MQKQASPRMEPHAKSATTLERHWPCQKPSECSDHLEKCSTSELCPKQACLDAQQAMSREMYGNETTREEAVLAWLRGQTDLGWEHTTPWIQKPQKIYTDNEQRGDTTQTSKPQHIQHIPMKTVFSTEQKILHTTNENNKNHGDYKINANTKHWWKQYTRWKQEKKHWTQKNNAEMRVTSNACQKKT